MKSSSNLVRKRSDFLSESEKIDFIHNLAEDIDESYRPSNEEEFMCDMHLAFFRKKLLDWKKQLISEMQETIQEMQSSVSEPDFVDIASNSMNQAIELRTRDRERKLIHKIDEALEKIDDGTYGYCEETGEPISLRRLEVRPIATLGIEAQERHENKEKVYS